MTILFLQSSITLSLNKLSRDARGGALGDNTSRQGWRINSRILLVATILFYFVLAYSSSYDSCAQAVILLDRTDVQKNSWEQVSADGIFCIFWSICMILLQRCVCKCAKQKRFDYIRLSVK